MQYRKIKSEIESAHEEIAKANEILAIVNDVDLTKKYHNPKLESLKNDTLMLIQRMAEVKSQIDAITVFDAAHLGLLTQLRKNFSSQHDLNRQDLNGNTPLLVAATTGKTNVLDFLLEYDIDINHCNNEAHCALVIAANNGHDEFVCELLKNHAKIDDSKLSEEGLALVMEARQKIKASRTSTTPQGSYHDVFVAKKPIIAQDYAKSSDEAVKIEPH